MNTRKQVTMMVALLMIGLLGIAVYSAWDPGRNIEAGERFNEKTADRGSILFARNCRLCHGDVGEGGALGGRLTAAPALNRPDLQGFVDSAATLNADLNLRAETIEVTDGSKFKSGQIILIGEERMKVRRVDGRTLTVERGVERTEADLHSRAAQIQLLDEAVLKDKVKLVSNTITCGRVGTPMPPWAQTQGGPLSDEQVRQLTVLITEAWWDRVAHEVDVEDAIKATLQREIDEATISLPVTDVSFFNEKEAIRIGDERMLVTGVPRFDPNDKDKSGIVQVRRGVQNSIPLPHAPDEGIFKFPLVAEPSINQQSCGQIAQAPPVQGTPGPKTCASPCQTVEISAVGVAFSTREIRVRTSGNVLIRLNNQDAGVPHNIAVRQSSTNTQPVAAGSVGVIFEGPAADEVTFATPSAGSYFFRCDVHPTTMTGTFVVQ